MSSVPAWNIEHEIGTRETVHFKASVEYGMRAVLYLAEKGSICSSREVADEMSIPRDYLIQLAQLLRNAGIVHARPGKNGGYSLAKDASEISMLDIFNALQNDRLRAERKEAEDASDLLQDITAACSAVEREMEEYMSSITLQNMIERIHGKESDTASGSTRSQTPA
ncbi:RrF2 family transcriptional regulator [Senegalimassilia anaerobia]|uniref:RrF2 family transcriptional regulator n=1 Tax=Senegalimassilia anaerobia TaxID=1473216 RepID=UPI0009DB303E|nr:Rrf2 family transcriptional regulator [Senegalimassilia anaerobia]